jgi:hypothetical protein
MHSQKRSLLRFYMGAALAEPGARVAGDVASNVSAHGLSL